MWMAKWRRAFVHSAFIGHSIEYMWRKLANVLHMGCWRNDFLRSRAQRTTITLENVRHESMEIDTIGMQWSAAKIFICIIVKWCFSRSPRDVCSMELFVVCSCLCQLCVCARLTTAASLFGTKMFSYVKLWRFYITNFAQQGGNYSSNFLFENGCGVRVRCGITVFRPHGLLAIYASGYIRSYDLCDSSNSKKNCDNNKAQEKKIIAATNERKEHRAASHTKTGFLCLFLLFLPQLLVRSKHKKKRYIA